MTNSSADAEVFVETSARLHFGVLDLGGSLGRWFGGVRPQRSMSKARMRTAQPILRAGFRRIMACGPASACTSIARFLNTRGWVQGLSWGSPSLA